MFGQLIKIQTKVNQTKLHKDKLQQKKMTTLKIHYQMQTQSLILRPYCIKYVKQYNQWFHHDQQLLYLTGSQPLTYQQELQNHHSWLNDPKKYTFLVFFKTNDRLIGDVNLFFSDWIENNQAQINVMIAVKEYRGKGLAHEIMNAIEQFALHVYNRNQIIAKIKDDNKASIRFFQKTGYKFINHNTTHGQVQYRKSLQAGADRPFQQKYRLKEQSSDKKLFQLEVQ